MKVKGIKQLIELIPKGITLKFFLDQSWFEKS